MLLHFDADRCPVEHVPVCLLCVSHERVINRAMFNLRVPYIRCTSKRNVFHEPRLPHLFARSTYRVLSRESLSFSHKWIRTNDPTSIPRESKTRTKSERRCRTDRFRSLAATLRAPLSRGEKRLWKIIQRRYSQPARTFRRSVIRLLSPSDDGRATSRSTFPLECSPVRAKTIEREREKHSPRLYIWHRRTRFAK